MLWVPWVRVVVAKVAVWVVEFTDAVPRVTVPFLKVTVPLGEPPKAGVTVAVKVTDLPTFDGLAEEVTLVVVAAALTESVTAGEVLVNRSVLPE